MRRTWRRAKLPESSGPVRNTRRAIRPRRRARRAEREDGARDRSAPHRPSPGRCLTQAIAHAVYVETTSASVGIAPLFTAPVGAVAVDVAAFHILPRLVPLSPLLPPRPAA